jgi:hypothetical protein
MQAGLRQVDVARALGNPRRVIRLFSSVVMIRIFLSTEYPVPLRSEPKAALMPNAHEFSYG